MEIDSGSIFDRYSDISDGESDGANREDEPCTVLSMLDDASLPEFDFCMKENVSLNLSFMPTSNPCPTLQVPPGD